MTYHEYIIKCEVAKTAFQCNVSANLSVEVATPEQRLTWIAEDLAKLNVELEAMGKAFDTQDDIGDPFAGNEVK
jgi:hypothetical protein